MKEHPNNSYNRKMDKHTFNRHIKNDIKGDKKIQQESSRNQHLKPSTSTKRICLHNMSRQPNSHFQMANYLSHIGYLIKGPTISKTELRDLLWHLQWNPPLTLHPNTQRICEQILQYITEATANDEQPIENKNMTFLSKTLEDITKIILSESPQKRIDLLNLYINKKKRHNNFNKTKQST